MYQFFLLLLQLSVYRTYNKVTLPPSQPTSLLLASSRLATHHNVTSDCKVLCNQETTDGEHRRMFVGDLETSTLVS
jgi:hypothetical protein